MTRLATEGTRPGLTALAAKVAAFRGTATVTLPGISQDQAYHLVPRGR